MSSENGKPNRYWIESQRRPGTWYSVPRESQEAKQAYENRVLGTCDAPKEPRLLVPIARRRNSNFSNYHRFHAVP